MRPPEKMNVKKFFKSVCFTSLPMVAISYIYGAHGMGFYGLGFFLGMLFQADLSFQDLYILFLRQPYRYYRCRLSRHKLRANVLEEGIGSYTIPGFLYCNKCDSFVKGKT